MTMLSKSPNVAVDQVRDYLREVELCGFTGEKMAIDMSVSSATLNRRLGQAGLHWQELKREEQKARLKRILEAPGKVDTRSAARECGFSYVDSFFRFFREVMGVGFEAWRRERQAFESK